MSLPLSGFTLMVSTAASSRSGCLRWSRFVRRCSKKDNCFLQGCAVVVEYRSGEGRVSCAEIALYTAKAWSGAG